MPLFSSTAELWMHGHGGSSGSMPLTIVGTDPDDATGTVPMFLFATTAAYKWEFNKLPLSIVGKPFGIGLNMFIQGDDGDGLPDNVATMNLFLHGEGFKEHNSVNLVIWGSNTSYELSYNTLTLEQLYSLTTDQYNILPLDTSDIFTGYNIGKGMTLYITGEGLYDNFVPDKSYLNLFLQGASGSERPLLLFIQGSPDGGNTVDLYLSGIEGFITNNLNLSMNTRGDLFQQLPLFIRGFKA